MAYWAQSDIENRLGAEVVRQLLDDNNDGTADSGPLAQVQADADSYVDGYLRGIYSLDAVRASPPNQVKRLSLDAGVMYLAQRHPELVRVDWEALKRVLDADLKALRRGDIRLDVESTPEPAANQTNDLIGASLTCPPVKRFIDGLGDF